MPLSLTQVWETKKVCKNSAIVLKQEIDVVFQENETMVLAVDNIRGLQVSLLKIPETSFGGTQAFFYLFLGSEWGIVGWSYQVPTRR
jgi:hypothetical protein